MFREKIKELLFDIGNRFEDVIIAIEIAIEKIPDIVFYILGSITGSIIVILIRHRLGLF